MVAGVGGSPAEIALMQIAMDITLTVHQAAAAGLSVGVSTAEVQAFLDAAHRKLGGQPASRAVQFGEATAYPHGLPYGWAFLVKRSIMLRAARSPQAASEVTTQHPAYPTAPAMASAWMSMRKPSWSAATRRPWKPACVSPSSRRSASVASSASGWRTSPT
jgi:hypothetical protein